jgi:hypothetical protein
MLLAVHASLLWGAPALLAPAVAGSVYLPLMLLQALGISLFAAAESGGWAAPSLLGWSLVGLLWLGIWWTLAGLLARLLQGRNNAA